MMVRRGVKKNSFLKDNYGACLKFLRESKDHVMVSLSVFCMFFIVGFGLPIFFREQIFMIIEELILQFAGLGFFETISMIFLNNIQASFLAVILGAVIGLFPLFAAISNGYLLGFVARFAVEEGGILVLWRLIPHGIFELPAIILSIGLGMKLGVDVLLGRGWKKFEENLYEAMRFFLFVIFPLILIAGIIEGILVALIS
jgi:stage II sporulation protein M